MLGLDVLLTQLETAAVFSCCWGRQEMVREAANKAEVSSGGGWMDSEGVSRDGVWIRGIRDGAWHEWDLQLHPDGGGVGESNCTTEKVKRERLDIYVSFLSDLMPAGRRFSCSAVFLLSALFPNTLSRICSVEQFQSRQPALCQGLIYLEEAHSQTLIVAWRVRLKP